MDSTYYILIPHVTVGRLLSTLYQTILLLTTACWAHGRSIPTPYLSNHFIAVMSPHIDHSMLGTWLVCTYTTVSYCSDESSHWPQHAGHLVGLYLHHTCQAISLRNSQKTKIILFLFKMNKKRKILLLLSNWRRSCGNSLNPFIN